MACRPVTYTELTTVLPVARPLGGAPCVTVA